MSPALNALRLLISIAAARAFYMPPAFDAEAVPGYNNTSESEPGSAVARNSSSVSGGAPVFDFGNHTAWHADSIHPTSEARSTASATSTPALTEAHGPKVAGRDTVADTPDESESGRGGEGAVAASVGPRDVWSPRIVAPEEGTTWTVGSTVEVRWDALHPPKRVTNYEGQLLLGHLEDGDETDEHLDTDHPLAKGFNLTQGHVKITVPHVSPSDSYIVVLFGDSGNRSQKFTIVE